MQGEEQQPEEKPRRRRVELTPRDLDTLRWVGEQGVVRADQLQKLLARQAGAGIQNPSVLSDRATRVWRQRMREIGAIGEAKVYHREPPYLWLTSAGMQVAGLDLKATKPAPSTLHHLYWCNQVRLMIEAQRPGDRWISERQLRREHGQATRERRTAPDLPDAHVVTPRGIIAIEVELSPKQSNRLLALLRSRTSKYYTVWYFVSGETKGLVEDIVARLDDAAKNKVQVISLEIIG